jgi:adenylate cyclase
VAAARDVVRAVERQFGGDVRVGIGINSGPVVVGSVGGGGRLEFAVIGDTVNIAARVEAITGHTGDVVLLTEATRCLLRDSQDGMDSRGAFDLKGISDPVSIYSALPDLDVGSPAPLRTAKADA